MLRHSIARGLLYGGLLMLVVFCLLVLRDPTRADKLVWRVAGVSAGVCTYVGLHMAASLRGRR